MEANFPQKAFVFPVPERSEGYLFLNFSQNKNESHLYSLCFDGSLLSTLCSQPLRQHRTILFMVALSKILEAFNRAHAFKFTPVVAQDVANLDI